MSDLRPALTPAGVMLDSLYPGRAVREEVVEAYLRLLERKSRFDANVPRLWAFEPDLFRKWKKGGIQAIRERLPEGDLLGMDLLLFPVCLPGLGRPDHWVLVVVCPSSKLIRLFDSLHRIRPIAIRMVRDFLEEVTREDGRNFCGQEWRLSYTPPECPRQKDKVSGGIFIMAFSEAAAAWATVRGLQVDQLAGRKRVMAAIRARRIWNEDFDLLEGGRAKEHQLRFAGQGRRPVPMMRIEVKIGRAFETLDLSEDRVSFRNFKRYGTAPTFLRCSKTDAGGLVNASMTEAKAEDDPQATGEVTNTEIPVENSATEELASKGGESEEHEMEAGPPRVPALVHGGSKKRCRRRPSRYVRVRHLQQDGSYCRITRLKREHQR